MATVSALGTATFNTTSGTHTVVATPAVGDLIVIIRANTGNVVSHAPTDTASGSYSLATSALKATSADLMEVWVRNSLITSATSTTFSDAPGTTTGGGLTVFKVTGMFLTGANAVRQVATQANQATAATPAPVFSSAVLTSNPVIGAVFNATSPATMTPRTGYTETTDLGYSTPTTGLESMFRSSGETGTTMTWGSASASAFCSVVVELNANTAAPTVALNTPADAGTVVTTTPQLAFTGTDADSDAIEYEVQVDAVTTFDSVTATPTRIQGTTGTTGATFPASLTTTAFGSSVTTGNAILVALLVDGLAASTTFTMVDSVGNSYSRLSTSNQNNIDQVDMWLATNVTGGSGITITAGNLGGTTAAIIAEEWSGVSTVTPSSALDQQTTATNTSTTAVSVGPTSATTTANDVIWYVVGSSGSVTNTTATGFSNATSVVSNPSTLLVQSKVVSSTGTQSASSTLSSAQSWEALVVAVKGSGIPLLDKLSASDTGFVDITNGAHTHPFTSGEQIGYTTTTLTDGSTYYWRVRGKDPSGTNSYGAWATTQSFTVSTGGGPIVTHNNLLLLGVG